MKSRVLTVTWNNLQSLSRLHEAYIGQTTNTVKVVQGYIDYRYVLYTDNIAHCRSVNSAVWKFTAFVWTAPSIIL